MPMITLLFTSLHVLLMLALWAGTALDERPLATRLLEHLGVLDAVGVCRDWKDDGPASHALTRVDLGHLLLGCCSDCGNDRRLILLAATGDVLAAGKSGSGSARRTEHAESGQADNGQCEEARDGSHE